MKAVVLAGGFATRLLPVTKHIPKPLLPVNGKPIINYIIEQLDKVEDVDEVIVSTNKRFEKHFEHWMSTLRSKKNVSLLVEPTLSEGEKFGSIKAIDYIIKKKKIDDDMLVIAGDNLFTFDLGDFVQKFRQRRAPHIALYNINDIEKAKRFGVMKIDETGRVVLFEEKPENPPSTLVSTACYIFPRETLELFNVYLSNGYNKDSPGFFIQWLYKKTNVIGYPFEGMWFDIGTLDAYDECVKYFQDINYINMKNKLYS